MSRLGAELCQRFGIGGTGAQASSQAVPGNAARWMQVIHLIRHGQGFHNLASPHLFNRRNELTFDAHLTTLYALGPPPSFRDVEVSQLTSGAGHAESLNAMQWVDTSSSWQGACAIEEHSGVP